MDTADKVCFPQRHSHIFMIPRALMGVQHILKCSVAIFLLINKAQTHMENMIANCFVRFRIHIIFITQLKLSSYSCTISFRVRGYAHYTARRSDPSTSVITMLLYLSQEVTHSLHNKLVCLVLHYLCGNDITR